MNPIIMNHHVEFLQFFFRIIVAIFCGFSIGFERQWINRTAGIQTNVLVCTGACVFILGSYFVSYEGQSASRIGAQIVSGIGFLGAGMIFKDGMTTHGINTAATIWCVAAVGVLCGMGLLPHALGVMAILVCANIVLRKIDHSVHKNRHWNDSRIIRQYEIQVIVSRDKNKELRKKILNIINCDDHHILSTRTEFYKQNFVRLTVGFKTHHLDYQRVQKISEKIEENEDDLIVDWAEIK